MSHERFYGNHRNIETRAGGLTLKEKFVFQS